MAGFKLFGGNYNRPGPGVRKDEQKKPPLIRFWTVFFRKLSKLIQLNLLFMIPVIVVCALILGLNVFISQPLLLFMPIILLSPFIAGLTMITRNFAREEHAFVLSDFIETVKKNWKPFFINGIICYVFSILLYVAVKYYLAMGARGWIFTIALAICIMVSCLFVFSQYYVPTMIITLDLKLKQIYKNALIFAFLGLWRNLMLTAIFAVLIFINVVIYYMMMPLAIIIDLLLIILIAFSFASYLINFAAYPLIEKMIIKPYYEKQNAPADKEEEEPAAIEELKENEANSVDQPEYVFIDGRLVKRPKDDDEILFNDKT